MATPQDVIDLAAREIGYRERGNNYNKFGAWYGMDGAPWCAMFLSYCFYVAGQPLPITTSKGFAYCPYGVDWFKSKGWWFSRPKVGDLVFYNWTGDGIADHVGLVEAINSDGSIFSIEGNTSLSSNSNGGEVMRRKRGGSTILGYGRPPYTGVRNPPLPSNYPRWSGRYITLTTPYTEGNDVLTWQTRMIERGWDLGTGGSTGEGDTGIFDERNHEVLIKFQEEKGLEVDGVIGPESWNAAWEAPITASLAVSAASIRLPKTALFDIGGETVWQLAGQSAFFYKSGMSINADGAPNAYHPQDKGIDYLANAGSPSNWWALVLDDDGEPVVQKVSDPFPGYYVSTTALGDRTKPLTDPRRYVDAVQVPYIVLPGNPAIRGTGVKLGDYAVVYNQKTGKLSYAIYADVGPRNELGEGSVALSRALGNEPIIRGKVARGIPSNVLYIVFPGSRQHTWTSEESLEDINIKAEYHFEVWGGMDQLKACLEDLD